MKRGTLCDWLYQRGILFPPTTVIVQANAVAQWLQERTTRETELHLRDYQDVPDIPPFDTMFVEFEHPVDKVDFGLYVSTKETKVGFGETTYHAVGYSNRYGSVGISYYAIEIRYDQQGLFISAERLHTPYRSPFQLTVPSHRFAGEGLEVAYNNFWHTIFFAMQHFHRKREFELVDYLPKYLRREQKMRGKAPSPYFRILDSSGVAKRYPSSGKTMTQNTMPLHRVRGHFRRNSDEHPIAHFAGRTFWIPAHERGNRTMGTRDAHYRIRTMNDRI